MVKYFFYISIAPLVLFSNPSDPHVVAGSAMFAEMPKELTITTLGKTIIDWNSFSIDELEITRFIQDAAVLNRVTGGSLSRIMGHLQANGEIYLLNPQGVLIGPNAVIQSAGFIASTLDIKNEHFLNSDKLEFFGDSIAQIVHQGTTVVEEGGRIYLLSNNRTELSGSLFAAEVTLLGDVVYVSETANIESPAGEVQIGENSSHTFVGKGARISVDGIEKGGEVTILADGITQFYGEVSGRGKEGGFVEISGWRSLDCRGSADLRSTEDGGLTGTLLLDPKDISIVNMGADMVMNYAFADDPTTNYTLSATDITTFLETANLSLEANNDILIQASVLSPTSPGKSLTLAAGRSIIFDATVGIALNGASFSATINADGADMANRDTGVATYQMNLSSSVTTQGGDITITHQMHSDGDVGEVILLGASLDAGAGDITITGVGASPNAIPAGTGVGVYINGGSLQVTGVHNVTIHGTGAALGDSNCNGVNITNGSISQAQGAITITGIGGGDGTGANNYGVNLSLGTISSTGSSLSPASITIDGTGGHGTGCIGFSRNSGSISTVNGSINLSGSPTPVPPGPATSGSGNYGILITNGSVTSSGSGSITITGFGGGGLSTGSDNDNIGVFLGNQTISSTSTGTITVNGTGGTGGYNVFGIQLGSANFSIVDGSLNLIGVGGATDRYSLFGINTNMGSITSTGAGTINIQGTGGTPSGGFNYEGRGVVIDNSFTILSSGSGNINITGTGSPSPAAFNCWGVSILTGCIIRTTGSGNIVISSTGGGSSGWFSNVGLLANGALIESTGSGTISCTGLGGPGNSGNQGCIFYDCTIHSSGTGNVFLSGTAGEGSNYAGFDWQAGAFSSNTASLTITGTGSLSSTSKITGINLVTVSLTSTGAGAGQGNITLNGIVPSGAGGNAPGILTDAASSIQTAGGNITINGTGNTGSTYGPSLFGSVTTTGLGNIVINSLGKDLSITGPVSANGSGNLTALAVTGTSSISFLGDIVCKGNFISAANNNITIAAMKSISIYGYGCFIVDQQNGSTYVPPPTSTGVFTNSGTISGTTNKIAIYAVYGPIEPVGVTPETPVNDFNNLSPPILAWDSSFLVPVAYNTKYTTSYSGGGPYAIAFGTTYTPGNGMFAESFSLAEPIVWYKQTGLPTPPHPPPPPPGPPPPPPPPPPGPSPSPSGAIVLVGIQEARSLVGVNAQVPPSYFFYQYGDYWMPTQSDMELTDDEEEEL